MVGGVNGDIQNLVAGGGTVDRFMTFTGTTLDFVLQGFGPGSGNFVCAGLAIGASCSVAPGSPFVLTNLGGNNSSIALAARGNITDAGKVSSWGGAFSTQVTLDPSVIQSIILAQGSVSSTYSAQFAVSVIPDVPEPVALSLFVVGLFGIATIRRFTGKS